MSPEKWTKRSRPPSSGVMKPKPFSSLNHLTVPVPMLSLTLLLERGRGPSCQGSRAPYHLMADTAVGPDAGEPTRECARRARGKSPHRFAGRAGGGREVGFRAHDG